MPGLAHNFIWNRIWCHIDAFNYRVESFHGSSAVWAAKMGRLSPFCSVCLSWRMHRAKAQQPGSVLHLWGSWSPGWSALFCWALLRCLEPCAAGRAQADWPGAHLQAAPAGSLRRFYLASVLVISRNFGKSLKDPPSCCAGALWDTLGFFSPAVLGFIRQVEAQNFSST